MLAILSEIDLSRLVSTLKANQQLDTGIELYGCGQVTKQISIIESGFAEVYTHEDLSELPLDEIDKTIGTVHHSLTHSLTHSLIHSLTYLLTYSLTHLLTYSTYSTFSYLLIYSLTHLLTNLLKYSLTHLLTHSLTLAGILRPRGCKKDPSYTAKQIPGMFFACTLSEGCVLGIEAMRSKAGFKDSW